MALGYFASLEYGTDGRVSLLPFGKEVSHIARMAVEKRKNQSEATTESTAFDTAENIAILETEMPNMLPGNEVRGNSCYSASYLARRARPSLSHCFRLRLDRRPLHCCYFPRSRVPMPLTRFHTI